jgi:hypothetical protein
MRSLSLPKMFLLLVAAVVGCFSGNNGFVHAQMTMNWESASDSAQIPMSKKARDEMKDKMRGEDNFMRIILL